MMVTNHHGERLCLPHSHCSPLRAVPFVLDWGLVLYQKTKILLSVPQVLAGALVVLAGLPDVLKPVPFPFPVGLVVGVLLPDLLFTRSVR